MTERESFEERLKAIKATAEGLTDELSKVKAEIYSGTNTLTPEDKQHLLDQLDEIEEGLGI